MTTLMPKTLYRRMRMLPHGSIARCARDLDLNERMVSNILRGRNKAAPTLARIEKWVEVEERGNLTPPEAA